MIVILDFGSQYTQLIARRIRELCVFSKVLPYDTPAEDIKEAKGIILSGGPSSVYGWRAPKCDSEIWNLNIPILGICYGMQLMVMDLGGEVEKGTPEYGIANLSADTTHALFKDVSLKSQVWMSHGDSCVKLPPKFWDLGLTKSCKYAVIGDDSRHFYGMQFHPEVTHTSLGQEMLGNFVFEICKITPNWTANNIIGSSISDIKNQVRDKKVLLALSGGVDSSTLAFILNEAIGNQLTCVFIDQGFMR